MIFHPYVLTKLEKEYAIRNLQVMMQIISHIQEAIWKIILLSWFPIKRCTGCKL